jgi:hypothetical protein
MNGSVRRVVLAVGWLAVALLISLGAAGIVAAMAHLPGTAARPELTYEGDAAIEPGLVAAEADLQEIAAKVRQLSELGRGALAALVASDVETLTANVTQGEDLSLAIETDAAELRTRLEALPGAGGGGGGGDQLTLSAASRERQARALRALEPTQGLAVARSRLAVGAVAAIRVTVLLADHDRVTGEAAAFGRIDQYAEALDRLTESDRLIEESRTLRDSLARSVDVSTLTQWLDLNAGYDVALRALYQSLLDSGGRVTPEVRSAFDAEAAAKERLPGDSKALVIILSEIGRGGLNQAVIGIEEARGRLDAALGLLGGADAPTPAP